MIWMILLFVVVYENIVVVFKLFLCCFYDVIFILSFLVVLVNPSNQNMHDCKFTKITSTLSVFYIGKTNIEGGKEFS